MRYIIIPLAIIAYLYWSYYGIKTFIKDYKWNKKNYVQNPLYSSLIETDNSYTMIHIFLAIVSVLFILLFFIIKNW